MALATGAFQTSGGVMYGALEQRTAKDTQGRRVWLPTFPSCGWLAHVSSVTMIHLSHGGVNTFSEQNVLIFNSRQTSPMASRQATFDQQTATRRTYESTELTSGILSGKVASPRRALSFPGSAAACDS